MKAIQTIISAMYQRQTSSKQAVKKLQRTCSKEELADFIVDAFNRGWISKFNLGLDDEGKII